MGQIIAIVNQKGGVGKTTTAVNITAALTALGKRVLLCDFDPQANATSGMGIHKGKCPANIYDVIINGRDAASTVVHTRYGDVLPSGSALAGAGVELAELENRSYVLKEALQPLAASYDFLFIELPALPGTADTEQSLRRAQHSHPGPMRILRLGRPVRPDGDDARGEAQPESDAANIRRPVDDV